MKEKILEYLAAHPGARKREIADHLHIWLCDGEFLHLMHELESDGSIFYKTYYDPAQMERYDQWYIKI